MLKTLLAVTLGLLLVAGLAGMASAADVTGAVTLDIDKTVDMTLTFDLGVGELDWINLSEITQDGPGLNHVGYVHQVGGGNFSEIVQDGHENHVGAVLQGGGECYCVSIITQQGHGNSVDCVEQN